MNPKVIYNLLNLKFPMKFKKQSPLHVVLLCLILIFQFSCSKDSDLLTDYVLADSLDSKVIANLVVDDTYQVSLSGSMVLDVLANDTFENEAEVVIIETSAPTNGTIAINDDETLLYTPNAEFIEQLSNNTDTASGEVVDTFTYTAEVVNGEGTTTSEEASVDITSGDNADKEDAVSLQSYGAIGDGVTDDTAALRNAFNIETNLISDAGKTYLISGTLNLNKNLIQTIDFNGSTITRKSTVHFMIDIDKRNYGNSLTTIKNLKLDGNNNGGSGIDVASRVNFENIEIYDIIHNGANGIRVLVYDDPGIYGQYIFDNVDIHNLESVNNDGKAGNDPGMVHGFLVSAQETPSQTTQIVYINSDLYELLGEDAGGITINSPGRDTSNSPLSFWFENITVADAQRRTVKNFIGNTTWINSTFTAAANDNPKIKSASEGGLDPAGLFVVAAGSSATGSTNNLICGCTFQGHPSDPFGSWYTQVLMWGQNGPTSMEIRNSFLTGGHGGRWGANGITVITGKSQDLTIANTSFGTTNTIKALGSITGTFNLDSNNTYADGKATALAPTNMTYTESAIPFEACPSIGD